MPILSILESLATEGRTLSGNKIIINGVDQTNWTRGKAIHVQCWLVEKLWDSAIDDKALDRTIEIFRKAVTDKKHYGNNSPQQFTRDRKPLYPKPTFNYWDFLRYSLSGYKDGYRGFAQDLRLDASVSEEMAVGIIGLLLVDSAINHLIDGDPYRACADIFDATQAFDEMIYPGSSALRLGPEFSSKARVDRKIINETRWQKKANSIWEDAVLNDDPPPDVTTTVNKIYDEEAKDRKLQKSNSIRAPGTIRNAIKGLRKQAINKAKAKKRRNFR